MIMIDIKVWSTELDTSIEPTGSSVDTPSTMKVTLIVLLAIVAVSFADLTPADPGFSLKDTLKLAKKYVKLIEKEGEKAWHFLECMGLDWAEHCVEPTVGCLATKNLAGCVALIACEGKDAKACSSKFK